MKFSKYITIISIILSSLAFNANAADSDEAAASATVDEIISRAVVTDPGAPGFDYAHMWFKEIFGGFIFKPWGGDSYIENDVTLLATAVGFTNILAMILGVVIIYYVFIGGAVNAAGKGEVMGQNWSGTWLPIRTLAGFSLIMPISSIAGGPISLAQVFIIWLIMLGSNAATVLWESLAGQIVGGTNVVSVPTILSQSTLSEVVKMMQCADIQARYTKDEGNYATVVYGSESFYMSWSETADIHYTISETYNSLLGDGYSNFLGSVAEEVVEDNKIVRGLQRIEFGENGTCGTVEFRSAGDVSIEESDTDMDKFKATVYMTASNAAKNAFLAHLDELVPLVSILTGNGREEFKARKMRAAVSKNKVDPSNYDDLSNAEKLLIEDYKTYVTGFNEVAIDYSTNLTTSIDDVIESDQVAEVFKRSIVYGGWAAAGMFYHEIGAMQAIKYRVINEYVDKVPKYIEGDICTKFLDIFSSIWMSNDCERYTKESADAAALVDFALVDSISTSGRVSAIDRVSKSCVGVIECNLGINLSDYVANDVGVSFMYALNTANVINFLGDSDYSDSPVSSSGIALNSPFLTLTSIGNNMINTGLTIMGAGMTFTFLKDSGALKLMTMAKGAAAGSVGGPIGWITGSVIGAGVANGIDGVFSTWVVPGIMALFTFCLGMGFMMAYVIPFMPITVWVLSLIGYLITVVEAVIAAPLAIIMMVTPEGEGISGTRLERAMQLIATVVLKPSLMIIGLIASITMSFVAFQIWNAFFLKMVGHTLGSGPINIVASITIYIGMAFYITKLITNVIATLPNQILEWFSSGVSRPFGEDGAEGGLHQSIGQVKDGIGTIGKGVGDKMSRERQHGKGKDFEDRSKKRLEVAKLGKGK